MDQTAGIALLLGICLSGTACFGPQDRRPGMWLPGEVAPTPSEWSFVNDYPEIAIEVRTPYFLRHSVTIVGSARDGDLFVGALDPDSKRWPAWADADPRVRLGVGDRVYEVELEPVTDPTEIARIRGNAARAGRSVPPEEAVIRHWRVRPRS